MRFGEPPLPDNKVGAEPDIGTQQFIAGSYPSIAHHGIVYVPPGKRPGRRCGEEKKQPLPGCCVKKTFGVLAALSASRRSVG